MLARQFSSIRHNFFSQFQVVSDIHLNHNNSFRLTPKSKYLVIAGDLTNGWTPKTEGFLQDYSPSYDKIFFVPGNHDISSFHRVPYSTLKNRMRATESRISNFQVLDDDSEQLRDGKIIGSTLWSRIPEKLCKYYEDLSYDFKYIWHSNGDKITTNDTNTWHTNAREFISDNIIITPEKTPILVVTHHAPLVHGTCHPIYAQCQKRTLNHAFCTDLGEMIEGIRQRHPDQEIVWLFGHTHYKCDFTAHDVRFVSNPVGLHPEKYQDQTL